MNPKTVFTILLINIYGRFESMGIRFNFFLNLFTLARQTTKMHRATECERKEKNIINELEQE